MATKSVTAQLDAERYAELKEFAESKEVDGKKLSMDQAASLILNTGLGRAKASRKYQDKRKSENSKTPRAKAAPKAKAAAKAPKAKAAAKAPKAKAKAKGDAPKAKAASKGAAPAKKSAVKVERKRAPIAAKKAGGTVSRLAPQRPAPAAASAVNGTPAPTTTEVAQA
jgi:hypothetical protein